MFQTEFVKSLNCNYERLLLDKNPEEKRYQYCILSRGGIKGLLPCSLRYMNGLAYLYYDITSKQSVEQLFKNKSIARIWVKDFMWSFRQIQLELGRFLLEENNILWYPEQIFQDLEGNVFSFLYVPYYEGNNGFGKLLDFLVEHIDYGDEALVECIYNIYERFEKSGEIYLREQIFEDVKILEQEENHGSAECRKIDLLKEQIQEPCLQKQPAGEECVGIEPVQEKRKFLSFMEGRKHKDREQRKNYRQDMQYAMEGRQVAEETVYEAEEYGRTIYIEDTGKAETVIRRLYSPEGKIIAQLSNAAMTIGKKKEEADLVLNDLSVSRIHARIIKEGEEYYLEDMNSTNGTFKNGLRMQPYEKRKLEEDDEIRLGKIVLLFR